MSTTTPNLGLTVPAMGDQISSTIPALGTNFQTIDNQIGTNTNQIGILSTYNVKIYGGVGDGVTDDTQAFINAINAIKTSETTENIPSQRVLKKLIVPGGIYKITARIDVPSYIHIQGDGRHITFLDSYITNGDPVINLTHTDNTTQQFYNTIEGFTINGRSQNCQGIKLTNVSRYILRDILVNLTNYEGLYMDTSYLGECYSVFLRGCGDTTHNSLMITAATSGYGGNAVSFFGGEIAGGQYNGAYCKNSAHLGFYGTTIEGFTNGTGLINDNCYALTARCYFEQNKQHIVEVSNTFSSNYDGSYFAVLQAGGLGHIGVYYAQGLSLQGCYFEGTTGQHIYDSTGNSTGKLNMSVVRGNLVQNFPIRIDSSIITSAQQTGTIIETFDGSFSSYVYGRKRFKDISIFESDLRSTKGITQIGNTTTAGTASNPSIRGGTGTPESVFIEPNGSLFVRYDGALDTSAYIKALASISGATNKGWKPIQIIVSGITASRPTVTTAGYQYFDTTLNKPIWWDGTSAWRDATGATV